MKRFRPLTLIAVAAVSVTALAAVQGLSVKRTPKEGAELKYEMSGSITVSGINVSMKATMAEKTTKVNTDGSFTIEETMLNGVASTDQGEMEIPSETVTTTFGADGRITALEGSSDPANGLRTANLGIVVDPAKPLSVGDKWTAEIKSDASKGIVAVKADYEVLGEEKVGSVDTVKISAKLVETEGSTPASSDSTFWISKADGSRVKTESTSKNLPSPYGLMDSTVTITLVP